MKVEKVIKEVIKIIRLYLPNEYKVYLFGSRAKGNALENSDIDIAILGKRKVDRSIFVHIKNDIENIRTLRLIDIVDLNCVDQIFRNNVLTHSQKIN